LGQYGKTTLVKDRGIWSFVRNSNEFIPFNMNQEFYNQNLQKASFKNLSLPRARFQDTDLRGADFSGADLSGADFSKIKTGITPTNKLLIFITVLIISLISGYFAMLAGQTVHSMLASEDSKLRTAGIVTLIIIVLFIIYGYWKGVGSAISKLIVPVLIFAAVIGVIAYFSGLGTGLGMLYLVLALVLVVIMFIVGSIARATAGTLSNVLFVIVALSGGIFGKSIGGGIGTTILALACMQISKRALSGAKGFDFLRKIAAWVTKKYGTSFRNSNMEQVHFSLSEIKNADFTGANISSVNWGDTKTKNCITEGNLIGAMNRK
jgi:uncharacterized protein YjbI with pentapeptide repeats